MSINERVRYLRKNILHLNQRDFAAELHIGQTAICMMEARSGVSERNIAEICRRWGVREEWLRTGEGEIFKAVETSVSPPDDMALICKVWPLIYAAAGKDERAAIIRCLNDVCS